MSYSKEVATIKRMFKKGNLEKDIFDNNDQLFINFPCIKNKMDLLCYPEFTTIPQNDEDGLILEGTFGVQWHRSSIDEHIDSAAKGEYFQVFFIKSKENIKVKYFDTRPLLKYYNTEDKKEIIRINDSESHIFKHSKPHSMIYYGDEVIAILRSVWKNKHYK